MSCGVTPGCTADEVRLESNHQAIILSVKAARTVVRVCKLQVREDSNEKSPIATWLESHRRGNRTGDQIPFAVEAGVYLTFCEAILGLLWNDYELTSRGVEIKPSASRGSYRSQLVDAYRELLDGQACAVANHFLCKKRCRIMGEGFLEGFLNVKTQKTIGKTP